MAKQQGIQGCLWQRQGLIVADEPAKGGSEVEVEGEGEGEKAE